MQDFKRIKTDNKELNELQDNLIDFFNNFKQAGGANGILNGIALKGIKLTNGSNKVAHKLKRKPQGCIITSKSSAVIVYDSAMDANFITLVANGDTTVNLWVY